jgi:hypothetical protein
MNTCDTIASDTAWVIKVLNSCETYAQYKVAHNVVRAWEKKYKFNKLFKLDSSTRVYHNRIREASRDVENLIIWSK